MTIHLLVVGQHDTIPGDMDLLASNARRGERNDWFRVKQCEIPRALFGTVREVAAAKAKMIDTLDLYDHAGPGHLRMGDEILFDHRGRGRMIARLLRPLLTPDARVRLLGCNTAVGAEGRELLRWLKEELGPGVTVYGSIQPVRADHFTAGIFQRDLEADSLFSSTEASARIAPDVTARANELASWHAAIRG